MNKILFRGRRQDDGEWEYGYYLGPWDAEKTAFIAPVSNTEKRVAVLRDTVGQFSGMFDYFSEMIFDGDVLVDMESNKLYVVLYGAGVFTVYATGVWGEPLSDWLWIRNAKITGNIYENPELMEKAGLI